MSEDNRETAADMFDRTAKLAGTLSERSSGKAQIALRATVGISKALAAIIRALGIKDASELIDALARDKAKGKITPEDIRKDDQKVSDAVDAMYNEKEDEEDATPAETPKSKKRSKRKT